MHTFTAYYATPAGSEIPVAIEAASGMADAVAQAAAYRAKWEVMHGARLGYDAISAAPVRIVDDTMRVEAERAAEAA